MTSTLTLSNSTANLYLSGNSDAWVVTGTAAGTQCYGDFRINGAYNSITVLSNAVFTTSQHYGYYGIRIQAGGNTITNNSTVLGTGGTIDIRLAATPTNNQIHFTNAGRDAFLVDATTPGYLAGTRILTDRGEVAIEDLAIGDRVVTLDGAAKPIKWIGRRAYSSAFATGNRDVLPILIAHSALGENVPARDLYVSPLQAVLFGDVLVPAEHLVNGKTIRRCPEIDPIRYFHIELENHDIILAEAAPAETFVDCDSRGMFHNAREFAELYPNANTDSWRFCFPRVESGPVLDRIRRGIAQRAGLSDAVCGSLDGNLDGIDGARISGWAFNPTQPDTPVVLEILDGDGLIARVTADRYRSDLEATGIGDGRHGFEVVLSQPLAAHTRHEIGVRRLADGQALAGSPVTIEAYDRRTLIADTHHAIDMAIADADGSGAMDAVLGTLLDGIEQVRRLRLTQQTPARRKTALFIGSKLPRVGQDAILTDIEALHAAGWRIECVAAAELSGGDAAVSALRAFGVTCHRAPLVASVEDVLRRRRNAFGLVCLMDDSSVAAYAALTQTWQVRAHLAIGAGTWMREMARTA